MSMKATIESAVKAGFAAMGDLVSDKTYTQVTLGAYDPLTGSKSNTTTNHTIGMIRSAYEIKDVDGTKIMATDQQFVAEARLFTFEPSTGDTITDGTEVFSVLNVQQDPAAVTYTLQGRR